MPTITTSISANITSTGDYEHTDYCSMPYTVELTIGDLSIDVDGWMLCGWLKPGANADLDGSGLANWGSSQPGGWTACRGDGAYSGTPHAEEGGDSSDDIAITGGEGMDSISISHTDVPEWHEAILARDAVSEEDDAWCDLDEAAQEIRSAVIEAINEAIEDACDDIDCPEPEADGLYDDLDKIDDLEDLPIRFGNWRGAGFVLAWKSGDDYSHTYWPTRSDVEQAIDDVSSDLADLIFQQIESAQEDE